MMCYVSMGFVSTFQADVETDEVYAQMTLQPLTPVHTYT